MAALTPLGLLAPGGGFGEDAPSKLKLGGLGLKAIPAGLAKYTGFWKHTLLDGYGFSSGAHPVIGYVVSAVVGTLAIGVTVFVIAVVVLAVARRHRRTDESAVDSRPGDKTSDSVGAP